MKQAYSTERVIFRLIQTPCCSTLLCWVNPRLPSHCPECGKFVYPEIKSCINLIDRNAMLRVSRGDSLNEEGTDT